MYNHNDKSKILSNTANKDFIKMIHWNAHSINNKWNLFEYFMHKENIDICVLTETHLNDNTAIDITNLQLKYDFIFRNRVGKKGGGVMICVNKSIIFAECEIPSSLNDIEVIIVKLFLNKTEYHLVGLYNPPRTVISKTFFSYLEQTYENVILMGDLNSKTLSIGCKKENSNGKVLEEILLDTNFIICNNYEHTHQPFNSSETDILDLVMCLPRERITLYYTYSNI
jgi:exonuclease III